LDPCSADSKQLLHPIWSKSKLQAHSQMPNTQYCNAVPCQVQTMYCMSTCSNRSYVAQMYPTAASHCLLDSCLTLCTLQLLRTAARMYPTAASHCLLDSCFTLCTPQLLHTVQPTAASHCATHSCFALPHECTPQLPHTVQPTAASHCLLDSCRVVGVVWYISHCHVCTLPVSSALEL